jgi:hypothetical protein
MGAAGEGGDARSAVTVYLDHRAHNGEYRFLMQQTLSSLPSFLMTPLSRYILTSTSRSIV